MSCLFCNIVSGQIPAKLLVDEQRVVAFEDINPQAPTHILVIPKSHFSDVGELALGESETLGEMFIIANKLASERGLAGYRTVFNTGAEAGQTVFHAHLHLLGGRAFNWPPG
jgi:histidine triad (HIT) family protein